jgi:hypothetical protein
MKGSGKVMARAKCKHCGEWLDTKEAIKVTEDGKNRYYCNALCCTKHSEELIEKAKVKAEYDEIFELTKEIFCYEFAGYSLLKREIDSWEKLTSRDKIIAYLKENKDWLSTTMSKEFSSDYHRVRYYSVVVSSKLHDYKPKLVNEPVKMQPKVVIDETMYEAPTRNLNKRRSLADLEDEL